MNRKILWIGGLIVVVLLLGAGAFTAVQLLAADPVESDGAGVQVFEDVFDDGSGPVTIRTIVEPSELLPDEPAAAGGVLTRREDNSLFVGTGSTSVNITIVNDEPTVTTDHSGPEIEVVISQSTLVYQDVTEIDLTATEDVERRLQQELRPSELPEDLLDGSSISAWGERRGDRVVATVVVFGETE